MILIFVNFQKTGCFNSLELAPIVPACSPNLFDDDFNSIAS